MKNLSVPFLLFQTAMSGLLYHTHQLSPSPSLMSQVSENKKEKSHDGYCHFKANAKHNTNKKKPQAVRIVRKKNGVSCFSFSFFTASCFDKTSIVSVTASLDSAVQVPRRFWLLYILPICLGECLSVPVFYLLFFFLLCGDRWNNTKKVT